MTKDKRRMNAFHPDFMKTFYPDFTKEFRTLAANQAERDALREGRLRTKRPRASVKVPKLIINTKAQQRMTMAEIKAELLKPREYRTYSKAGAGV